MSFDLILPFLRPIESLLLDESVSEIMGNPDATWWYERDGIICPEGTVQFEPNKLRTGLEVIANHLGKRLDEDNPLLHAQLPDGSRIAAVIPPVVRPSPALTIRKFTNRIFTIDHLISRGTLSRSLADYLGKQISSGKTILISGGTGTGKTTLLNILAQAIVAVATSGDVREQPRVADGASELLQSVFGKGKNPSRLVHGVASLPFGTPVELELIFEVS